MFFKKNGLLEQSFHIKKVGPMTIIGPIFGVPLLQ